MNKTDLINAIAAISGLNKKNSESALNAFIASVESALQKGEKVVLVGFGIGVQVGKAVKVGYGVSDATASATLTATVPSISSLEILGEQPAAKVISRMQINLFMTCLSIATECPQRC